MLESMGNPVMMFLILVLMATMPAVVLSSVEERPTNPRVYGTFVSDDHNYLNTDQTQRLSKQVREFTRKHECDFAVVVTRDTAVWDFPGIHKNGNGFESVVDTLRDHWRVGLDDSFGHGGVLFVLSIETRDMRIRTDRKLQRDISDARADEILEGVIEYMRAGDYEAAIRHVINSIGASLSAAEDQKRCQGSARWICSNRDGSEPACGCVCPQGEKYVCETRIRTDDPRCKYYNDACDKGMCEHIPLPKGCNVEVCSCVREQVHAPFSENRFWYVIVFCIIVLTIWVYTSSDNTVIYERQNDQYSPPPPSVVRTHLWWDPYAWWGPYGVWWGRCYDCRSSGYCSRHPRVREHHHVHNTVTRTVDTRPQNTAPISQAREEESYSGGGGGGGASQSWDFSSSQPSSYSSGGGGGGGASKSWSSSSHVSGGGSGGASKSRGSSTSHSSGGGGSSKKW